MSVYSFTSWECTFPKAVAPSDPRKYFTGTSFWVHDDEENYFIDFDGDTGYANGVVLDLIEYFNEPLDKVEGLCLSLRYSTDYDGHYECTLDIEDGECTFEESEVVMIKKSMRMCPISIDLGTSDYRRRKATEMYDALRAAKWDDGKLAEPLRFFDLDENNSSYYFSEGMDIKSVLMAIEKYEEAL